MYSSGRHDNLSFLVSTARANALRLAQLAEEQPLLKSLACATLFVSVCARVRTTRPPFNYPHVESPDRYRESGTPLSYSSSPGTQAELVRPDSTTTARAATEIVSRVEHL
jgi:hypothetical protein